MVVTAVIAVVAIAVVAIALVFAPICARLADHLVGVLARAAVHDVMDLQRLIHRHVHAELVRAIPVELEADLVAPRRHVQPLEDAVEVVGDPGVVAVHVHASLLRVDDDAQRSAVAVAAAVVVRRVAVGAAVVERRVPVGAVVERVGRVVVVVAAVVVRRAVVVVAAAQMVAGAGARTRVAPLRVGLGRRGIASVPRRRRRRG